MRSKKDLETFFELGGFLDGIKVGKGSPYYKGLDKQKILITLLKFIKENGNASNAKELHSKIKQMVEK